MQVSIILTSLFVTYVAASSLEAGSPVQVSPQNVGPVVGNSPVVGPSSGVETPQQPSVVGVEPHHPQHHGSVESHHLQHHGGVVEPHHLQPHHGPSYYSPSGMITVVGEQGQNKPGAVRNFEQYGQPESASLPANYKPFGSWGLYIGGNPADGYYTNYYKQLSNSVDKQQAGEPAKPVGSQTAAFSPFLRQAGSSPFAGGDYYPFAYSPADLNSGVRQPVPSGVESSQAAGGVHPPQSVHNVYAPGSPSVDGAPVYGGPLSYADQYATKKIGQSFATKEAQREVQVQQPVKGAYPARIPYQSYQPYASPVAYGAAVQHSHVVAYPVPVGSQIVGSQPGVDGAYGPYGVHAFTRYAVKPTVLSHDPSAYYYSAPAQYPTYKQQQVHTGAVSSGPSSYYPLSFYGFPLSHLNGVHPGVGPSQDGSVVHHVGPQEAGVHHQGHSSVVGVHQAGPVSEEKVEEVKPQ